MQQVVFDFEREERTARPQHAKHLGKRALLGGSRGKVMQHQNGNCRRKGSSCEWQRGSIGLHDSVPIFGSEPNCKIMTPLEARHTRRESLQCGGACTRPGAQFEHVVSERIPGNDPRQQVVARDALPESRRAKPVFECVQFSMPING